MTKKKKAKTLVLALCAIVFLNMFVLIDNPFAYAASPDLFISEYVEGTSNNKAIEIYNNTGSPVDLAASGYSLRIYFNGSATAGTTVNLNGIVGAGRTYVVVQSLASPALLALSNQISTASWFNGDDAVVLMKGETTVDRIGTIGVDPGTAWVGGGVSALDRTLVRKPNITQGDTNSTGAFNPSDQWVSSPIDTFSNLGSHSLTTFQVTFDLGIHGTLAAGSLVQTITIGDNAISPTVQANPGYTFTGWDTSFSSVTSSLTVTAQYTKNSYSVEFKEGDHGTFDPSGQPATQQVPYEDPAAAPTVVTAQGYTFTGWDKTFNSITNDVVITAQYNINTYSVIFSVGEGASFQAGGGTQEQSVIFGNLAVKPETPSKSGYTFAGWYSDMNLTVEYSFSGAVQQDLTLYANWTKNVNQGFPLSTDDQKQQFPLTGDESHLPLLIMLCALGLLGMGIQYRHLRKS